MGIERTGRSADFKRGQDGGIDLQKALFVQVSADLFQDLAALDKSILDFGVDDQVNIALAVTGFTVSQAMELSAEAADSWKPRSAHARARSVRPFWCGTLRRCRQ